MEGIIEGTKVDNAGRQLKERERRTSRAQRRCCRRASYVYRIAPVVFSTPLLFTNERGLRKKHRGGMMRPFCISLKVQIGFSG